MELLHNNTTAHSIQGQGHPSTTASQGKILWIEPQILASHPTVSAINTCSAHARKKSAKVWSTATRKQVYF